MLRPTNLGRLEKGFLAEAALGLVHWTPWVEQMVPMNGSYKSG